MVLTATNIVDHPSVSITAERYLTGIDELFPYIIQRGMVWWVDNDNGSDSNEGTYEEPFDTVAHALTLAESGRGDTIIVLSTHTESLASQVISLDGLSIIALPHRNGATATCFTIDHTGTGDLEFAGDGMRLEGVKVINSSTGTILLSGAGSLLNWCQLESQSGTDDVVQMIGASVELHGCLLTGLPACAVTVQGDGCKIIGCSGYHRAPTTLGGTFIKTNASAGNHIVIARNTINSYDTGAAADRVFFDGSAGGSGILAYNRFRCTAAQVMGTIIVPGNFACIQNFASNADNRSGALVP